MYIKTPSTYPYSLADLRREHPQTSFPQVLTDDTLAEFGVFCVLPAEPPAFDAVSQSVTELPPVMLDGVWHQQWAVSDKYATKAELDAAIEAERRALVPQTVTMRQARLALLNAGLLDDVDAAINALPSPQKEAARIEWEYSQEVQRHNGFVSVLAPLLGLTDAQTDALFLVAEGL